jgi:hypothetical protein
MEVGSSSGIEGVESPLLVILLLSGEDVIALDCENLEVPLSGIKGVGDGDEFVAMARREGTTL